MPTAIRHLMLASVVLLGVSLTGCVKFKQTMTLMPDGSGKFDLVIGLSEQLVQMAKQQGENPFDEMDPKNLDEDSTGIVAFTKPTQKKEGGYTYLSFSAYFKDINEVELGGPEEGEEAATFTYTRDGESATLTAEDTMVLSAVKNHEPVSAEEKQFAAAMMAGMLFSEAYVLPGGFEDIKGVKAEGSTATIEMTQDHMLDGTGPIKELKGVEKLVFKISGIKEDGDAMKAFKAEMEAAIKEWEAIKAEAEAE